jgi:hypothetical protein
VQGIEDILTDLYASVPYELLKEVSLNEYYYHSIFFLMLKVIGENVHAEIASSKGRADIIVELSGKVYIIEMKYSKLSSGIDAKIAEAVGQIEEKRYADSYKASGKEIFKLAVALHKFDYQNQDFESHLCAADRSLVKIVRV